MSTLIHNIYASVATHRQDPAALARLLQKARDNNARLGLSGMLLYSDGSFFQVLEGPASAVQAIYERIRQDPRHEQVTSIISEPIARRSFDAWTMGFSSVSREDLAGLAGVNDFFGEARGVDRIDAGRARKLLAAFRDGRWRKRLATTASIASA